MTIPFLHQTDLFHPHGDPDDHWDLATVYALAARQALDLQGVLLDYPPARRPGDPATLALAQLGQISGVTGIPFAVGSPYPLRSRTDTLADRPATAQAAARWLCRLLENSRAPVIIQIVGSCTDVALAGRLRPDLFASSCKAVYLNAGAAHPGKTGQLEYNVTLNPGAYAAIFDLSCPVYWCPCWDQSGEHTVGPHGTWYSFRQGDLFARLTDPLCQFFLYMLNRSTDPQYLRELRRPVDPGLREAFGAKPRNMWSTAAILHAAGIGVDTQGGLHPGGQPADPLFGFIPVTVACADDGQTTWTPAAAGSNRHLFQVRRPERYPAAMTAALGTLLETLGADPEPPLDVL